MRRSVLLVVFAAAIVGALGHAEEMQKPGSFVASPSPGQQSALLLIGSRVFGPEKRPVGFLHDILFNKEIGKAEVYVMDIGGFLGIGVKQVAMTADAFKIVMTPGKKHLQKLMTSRKMAEFESAPEFDYKKK